MNGRPWTKREIAIVRRDYPHLLARVIAFRIKRSTHKIHAMASTLGLHKTAAFFVNSKARGRFDKLSSAGTPFRYPKGHVPANKGLRRPGWHRGRMQETQFKKGQLPHNWHHEIGATRSIDGYLYRKVREASPWTKAWKQVHHLIWIEHVWRIPKKHLIVFKDGNRQPPILLSNLECISRAENARRNNMWVRLPRELTLAINLRGQLKRRIRERQRREQDDYRSARKAVRHHRPAERQGKPARDRARPRDRRGRRLDHRKRQGRSQGDAGRGRARDGIC